MGQSTKGQELNGSEVAIIGMACRFPGANSPEEFWRNLCGGVESLTRLTADDLRRAGLDPSVLEDARYVPFVPAVEGVELFDAGFFGYTPLEAKLMDPQHRLFLECAWEAFEQAGHSPEDYPGKVGVFTGSKTNTYLFNLFANQEFFQSLDLFQVALGNDLACMATRVAYKFDLRGPSYAVHTACSTSLVAVHIAYQSLLLRECDMALAGGAAINVPQHRGYFYQKGGILSPDGHCRTFDADAQGSNFGNGVGAVLLKRLEDALADGDQIYAIIRGSASNNDGARKASYTAPGVEGQTDVLLEAMACAGVDPETISYVEAHGTATDLGDAIEMLALNEAFGGASERKGQCAIGSVKTNVGHLEVAAGVAGLIKTALALKHRRLPPSLHFERPNPKIDFANSPFRVNTELTEWETNGAPRRAGVSSFGIGSANAHVVLEEAPPQEPSGPSRPWQLLMLSARTESALEAASANLVRHLKEQPQLDEAYLADVAFTLQTGRKAFPCRRAVVCRGNAGPEEIERALDPASAFTQPDAGAGRRVAFLFPGLGDHYPRMGQELYRTEATFREHLDRGAEILRAHLGSDIREVLYGEGAGRGEGEAASGTGLDFRRMVGRARQPGGESAERLNQTDFIQPATFVVEYALAQLWMEWGIRPKAMLGYSLGEYVAACLAGVLSFDDALALVAMRARMIQALPPGAMLAVALPESEVADLVRGGRLSLAATNGPGMCVLSGTAAEVEAAERELAGRQVVTRRLQTSHAFHSKMMEPLVGPLTEYVRTLELRPPQIPYVSNVTGTWITEEQATDPAYWARHLCGAVRFSEGAGELLRGGGHALLEVGPGQGLTSFVKQHPDCDAEAARLAFATLPGAYDGRNESAFILETLGKLWLTGQSVNWPGFYGAESRRRVPLPTYPFERQRYWVDSPGAVPPDAAAPRRVTLDKKVDIAEWFYKPEWQPAPELAPASDAQRSRWLVFEDDAGLGASLVGELRAAGHEVLRVGAGEAFARRGESEFVINPRLPADYASLLSAAGGVTSIVHLFSLSTGALAETDADSFDQRQDLGFYSLLFLAQALGRQALAERVQIEVVTRGVHRVVGGEELEPGNATVIGPARVIPQEFPKLTCRCIDVDLAGAGEESGEERAERLRSLAGLLVSEFAAGHEGELVAYRAGRRFVQEFRPVRLEDAGHEPARLREKGVYLITGGLGGLGLVLAEHLARKVGARLVLTGRTELPARDDWAGWLEAHGEGGAVSEKIRAVLRLEELGAEVLAVAADAGDESRMRQVMVEAEERFGAVNGVVHLAGMPGGGIIQLKSREAAEQIIGPKAGGALVLKKLFDGRGLDFLVLYSSIASVLGEFGQADYCGANALLDALAQSEPSPGAAPTVVINWDIWRDAGLAVHTDVPPHLRRWREEMLANGIRNEEGVEAFERILTSGLPRVVVSTQDLPGRVELGKSFTGESFLQELQAAASTGSQPRAERRVLGTAYVGTGSDLERSIAEVWQRVLGAEQVGVNDNFFDLGGNSLLGLQLVSEIGRELGLEIAPVTLFEFPTVRALAGHLSPRNEEEDAAAEAAAARRKSLRAAAPTDGVAIIGMAGRFPGAPTVEQLWSNLCEGVESVTFFSDEELEAAGISRALLGDSRYVKAGSVIDGVELFDAGLFGFSPREAEVMDPQHRLFLECAWEVLERAGYDPTTYAGSVGVFAGSNLSTYLLRLHADPKVRESVNMLQAILGNDKDSLTTMVSYKLNLRGPSIAVQTFCSTSLVAVHMACQSLRSGECDMALAGGVRVVVPERQGYLHERGGIAPSDGHTRSFDARADGSILGNGLGLVCLKRLEDAIADGDHIHAVIKGSAVNNDGSLKAGYTAPSVAGQAEAILAAFDEAGVEPSSISYVEAHGSATELGDPIEVAALTKAFRARTDRKQFCPIGSVKSNFGHLDRAAGVTALIKTAMALEQRRLPPSINYGEPNPKIDFANSPFYVNTSLAEWPADDAPRLACVNSLGMGGTNAHVILEEAPAVEPSGPSRPWQLLTLSARSEAALDEAAERLAQYAGRNPEASLADIAFTLKVGRRALEYRRAFVCESLEEARDILAGEGKGRAHTSYHEEGERPVVFMFPGLGGQYVNMARGLYESEPIFREELDRCFELLAPALGLDLRAAVYPEETPAATNGSKANAAPVDLRKMLGRAGAGENGDGPLDRTAVSQPLLFAVEYALARLWMSWGVRPQAMVGYSLGEYVAACLAGVFSLEDALRLVAERARMIEGLPAGALLAVGLPEHEALPLLGDELSLMAVNGPEQCVVSGPAAAVEALQRRLTAEGTACRRLQAAHAFHSRMMEPLFDSFVELAQGMELHPPRVPYLSNVTGGWVRPEEATDPAYWARHMCQPVRFSEAAEELLKDRRRVLLEIGPPLLTSIVLQHPAAEGGDQPTAFGVLRHSYETHPDAAYALQALGKLWLAGVQPDWQAFYADERRRRVILPCYPFQRRRYWIDAQVDRQYVGARQNGDGQQGGWFYVPSWRRAPSVVAPEPAPATASDSASDSAHGAGAGGRWWLLADEGGIGDELAEALESAGRSVTRLRRGDAFARLGPASFAVSPARREDFSALLEEQGAPPESIVCLWGLPAGTDAPGADESLSSALSPETFDGDGHGLLTLLGVLGERATGAPLKAWVVSEQAHDVTGEETLRPSDAGLVGACAAAARDCPGLVVRNLDVVVRGRGPRERKRLLRHLLAELTDGVSDPLVAYRGGHRWLPTLAAAATANANGNGHVPSGDSRRTLLVINGLGELGSTLCEQLARGGDRLVLVEPPGFLDRESWDEWLSNDAAGGQVAARIRRARAVEGQTETLILSADLADTQQARSLLARAEERFGSPDGVVYVFDPEPYTPPAGAGPAGAKPSAAVRGLLALDEALGDERTPLRLLISSTRPHEALPPGERSLTLLLDAFASDSARDGRPAWTSVTWNLPPPTNGDGAVLPGAVERLFKLDGARQVIVSPEPLADGWNKVAALMETGEAAPEAEPVALYPRPGLRVDYVAPRNAIEQTLADLWRELLGVDQVGVNDNFLALGGDSLLAVRLISRMRDVFHRDFPVRLIFESATVAELAEAVGAEATAGTGVGGAAGAQEDAEGAGEELAAEDLAELMSLLEGLSEEDVERELSKRRQSASAEASA